MALGWPTAALRRGSNTGRPQGGGRGCPAERPLSPWGRELRASWHWHYIPTWAGQATSSVPVSLKSFLESLHQPPALLRLLQAVGPQRSLHQGRLHMWAPPPPGQSRGLQRSFRRAQPAACVRTLWAPVGLFQLFRSFISSPLSLPQGPGRPRGGPRVGVGPGTWEHVGGRSSPLCPALSVLPFSFFPSPPSPLPRRVCLCGIRDSAGGPQVSWRLLQPHSSLLTPGLPRRLPGGVQTPCLG